MGAAVPEWNVLLHNRKDFIRLARTPPNSAALRQPDTPTVYGLSNDVNPQLIYSSP